MTGSAGLIERFRAARSDPELVVVEGFHALKHALRFGAEVLEAVAADPDEVAGLAGRLAPDLVHRLPEVVAGVPPETLAALTPTPPPTAVVALARRPRVDARAVVADRRTAPVLFLEAPRHPGNVGAAIRVAAATEAAGVLTSGPVDPWGPAAVRGAAGLQFAVPVARVDRLPEGDRPVVAIDPEGEPLHRDAVPEGAVLAFGAERAGLSSELRARAVASLGVPMRDGVSSLNLATAVAAVLYVVRVG